MLFHHYEGAVGETERENDDDTDHVSVESEPRTGGGVYGGLDPRHKNYSRHRERSAGQFVAPEPHRSLYICGHRALGQYRRLANVFTEAPLYKDRREIIRPSLIFAVEHASAAKCNTFYDQLPQVFCQHLWKISTVEFHFVAKCNIFSNPSNNNNCCIKARRKQANSCRSRPLD